jgi:hypothetical protein
MSDSTVAVTQAGPARGFESKKVPPPQRLVLEVSSVAGLFKSCGPRPFS